MTASPQNPLYERYTSPEMAALWSAEHRYRWWRSLWITLAACERELGLAISAEQVRALEAAAPLLDLARVAEIERLVRHDVVAHLRHFAEQSGAAGGILHLGATSAFITDNADALIARQALGLLRQRLVAAMRSLAEFSQRHAALPCLAYTHFQPAQLTTVGKRAALWLQDLVIDLDEIDSRLRTLRCRGAKGTTGTQASFLVLFGGDHDKVRALDRLIAERLGFAGAWPVTGQTYPRKQDSQLLWVLAGIAESAHKLGTDLRLLQGVGELSEPFDQHQVGSSAMPYKRNPVRAERMCGLARRLITDSLAGPLNAATQWLERSLDDSANRRLVLADSFLTADAVLSLLGGIAAGLQVNAGTVRARVARELPFMATETVLLEATLRGGDRQQLHERIRQHALRAHAAVEAGSENLLLEDLAGDPAFRLSRAELARLVDPLAFTGRAERQVEEFLAAEVAPRLAGQAAAPLVAPRV